MSDESREFHAIYHEYYPKIVSYLRRLVGEADAEDVAQETFVKASRALDGFRGESALSTWLHRIAANAAADHFRKPAARQASGNQVIPDGDDLPGADAGSILEDTSPLSDALLIRKDMNECIRGLVNGLPDNYRTVLLLSDLEGFTNAEIADILGLSLDTVKIRLHRARTRLRKVMDEACHLYHDSRNELACDRKTVILEFRKNAAGVSSPA